eukprot:COSAG01_NODE_22322_length_860_cov_1.325887_1_plen_53_part_10
MAPAACDAWLPGRWLLAALRPDEPSEPHRAAANKCKLAVGCGVRLTSDISRST